MLIYKKELAFKAQIIIDSFSPTWIFENTFKSWTGPGPVAHLIGASSITPKGCRFDSRSGYIPTFGFDLWSGRAREATDQYFSLMSMFLSLKSINISFGADSKQNKRSWRSCRTILLWGTVTFIAGQCSRPGPCPLNGDNVPQSLWQPHTPWGSAAKSVPEI